MTRATAWPAEWPGPVRAGSLLSVTFFGTLTAIALIVSFVELTSDPPNILVSVAFALGAVMLGAMVVMVGVPMRRGRMRAKSGWCSSTGEQGLAVHYSLATALAGVMLMLTLLALALLAVYGGLVGSISILGSPMVVVVGAGAFAAMMTWYLVGIARGAIRRGRLWLTPTGVISESWSGGATASWDSILGVEPDSLGQAGYILFGVGDPDATKTWQRTPGWKPPELTTAPTISVPIGALGTDPAKVLATARFYHANPVARSELGTPAALRRITTVDASRTAESSNDESEA